MSNPDIAERVHFVLVDTTHAGNIGAAARAMKTMGFSSLRLVQTESQHQSRRSGQPHLGDEAQARASGASDILEAATQFDSLEEALSDCVHAFGTSARSRSLEWQTISARDAGTEVRAHYAQPGSQDHVAFVFGRERSGLTNEELALCSHRLNIPTNPLFSSLNLGSAVQVIAYELHESLLAETKDSAVTDRQAGTEPVSEEDRLADNAGMERFFVHLEQTLITIGFLNPENPRLLMPRLRRYFSVHRPRQSELNILRGILTAVNRRQQS